MLQPLRCRSARARGGRRVPTLQRRQCGERGEGGGLSAASAPALGSVPVRRCQQRWEFGV